MEDSNELISQKSWWDRNWKWFVPTGCLSIIVLIGLFIAGVVFGVTSMMTESDVYKDSMIAVKNNKILVEKLGNPIETDGTIMGSISTSNNSGNCNLEVPLKGPKGKGTLFIIAHKQGKWKYDQLSVSIENTKEEIDLLKKQDLK